MASISTSARGFRRILFANPTGKRITIHLGACSMREAENVKRYVETLLSHIVTNTVIDADTARWIDSIGDVLHAKLAAAGLFRARSASTTTLEEFIVKYRTSRADVAAGTSVNYSIVSNRMLAFFAGSTLLRNITESEADRWIVWLKTEGNAGKGYAGATVSKTVKVARQFWGQAIRDGVVESNPFAHLRTPSEVNTARAFFVEAAMIEKVLEACPDAEWRLLIALARFGGLRTPSEPLSLELADINWGRDRFRIVAPKTKHADGGERWIPIFPELRPLFLEACEHAPPGAVYALTRFGRDPKINLRVPMERICRKAGVKTWPRLFQNMRATRETELTDRFPIHVVAEWLGNSPKTALAHYTQTTEQHYLDATVTTQNPAQQATASASEKSHQEMNARLHVGEEASEQQKLPVDTTCRETSRDDTSIAIIDRMTPTGFDFKTEVTSQPIITANFKNDDAESGAFLRLSISAHMGGDIE